MSAGTLAITADGQFVAYAIEVLDSVPGGERAKYSLRDRQIAAGGFD